MIGNDVVDLHAAKKQNTRWLEARLWDKVFTRSEQQVIKGSEDQFRTVWQLWSMKESAYKIFVQQHGQTFFNPSKIHCKLNSAEQGSVFISKQAYRTTSVLDKGFIYTTALSNEDGKGISVFVRSKDRKHDTICNMCYDHLLDSFSRNAGIRRNAIRIKKTDLGVPELFANGKKANISLSITHHGAYYGFAYVHTGSE